MLQRNVPRCRRIQNALAAAVAYSSFAIPVLAQAPSIAQGPVAPATVSQLREFAADHGFVVLLGEDFAGRWVFDQRCDEGPYHDRVFEAVVDGRQSTNTRTTLDLLPGQDAARLQLVLNGVTKNRSLAKTPQAAIETEGNYQFQLSKQVEFDGRAVKTWSPAAFMQIQQRHLGAQTPVSMVPLLGPLSNSVALSVAQQRKPMAEQIAAQRVTESVAPEFNRRVDDGLAKLNQQLDQGARAWLTSHGLAPQRVAARSTDDALFFGAAYRESRNGLSLVRLGDSTPLSPDIARARLAQVLPAPLLAPLEEPQYAPVPSTMITPTWEQAPLATGGLVAAHESLTEDISSRSQIAGLRISDTQLSQFLNPEATDDTQPAAGLVDLIFSPDVPIATEYRDGEILFKLRLTFQPRVGPALPEQEIVVASRPVLESTQIRFPMELRSLKAVQGWPDETMRTMAEPILRGAISQRLKERSVPREFDLPREGRPPIPARVHSLGIEQGWLSVVIEPRPLPTVNLRQEYDVQAAQRN